MNAIDWNDGELLRGAVLRVAAGQGNELDGQAVEALRSYLIPAYSGVRYGRRDALDAWVSGWRKETLAGAAADAGVTERAIQLWVSEFIAWIPGFLRRVEGDRQAEDALSVFCDLTHRRKTGSRRPANPELMKLRAQTCIGCTVSAA